MRTVRSRADMGDVYVQRHGLCAKSNVGDWIVHNTFEANGIRIYGFMLRMRHVFIKLMSCKHDEESPKLLGV